VRLGWGRFPLKERLSNYTNGANAVIKYNQNNESIRLHAEAKKRSLKNYLWLVFFLAGLSGGTT